MRSTGSQVGQPRFDSRRCQERGVWYYSCALLSYCNIHLCVFITMFMATLFFILFIFLIAMFIVYFDYMSSIVSSMLLNSCICSYSAHPKISWVSDVHYVSVVLIYITCLQMTPDVLGHVVDCGRDRSVESSVVHPPYIGKAERGRVRGDSCVSISSLVDAPYALGIMI
jgi:hypothetical protein